MDFKSAREIVVGIKKDVSLLRREKSSKRRVDASKLLTVDILNSLAKKDKNFNYNYKGKDRSVNSKELKKNRSKIVSQYNRKGTNIQALMKGADNDIINHSNREIRRAHVQTIKGDIITIYTGKSFGSKWRNPFHRCLIKLKAYNDCLTEISEDDTFKRNAQAALGSDIGVYCDCEDFQYRRNYWATSIGAYVDEKTKETAFPKITHKTGSQGVLCIHLVKALKILVQPLTVNMLAKYMKKDAKSIVAGDARAVTVTDKEYQEFVNAVGEKKINDVKNQWLDKEARKLFKEFNQAGESFKKHSKDMLSKERDKARKEGLVKGMKEAQRVYDNKQLESAREMLVDGMDKKLISKYLKIDIKTIDKIKI